MSSSETGPAVMPSGGFEVSARYSEKRRREATEVAIFFELVEVNCESWLWRMGTESLWMDRRSEAVE